MNDKNWRNFWKKVNKTTTCWLWTGSLNRGYGRFGVDGKLKYAHKLIYEQTYGILPKGKQLDHICRARACVNPTHLEIVSNRENVSRGKRSKLNTSKTSVFTGVSWNTKRKRWEARFYVNGKYLALGMFKNELDAAKAYENAKQKYS